MSPDQAVARLARMLALTQLHLQQQPLVKANLDLCVEPLLERCEAVIEALSGLPDAHVIHIDPQVFGVNTAALLAEGLGGPVPDTVPDDWKE